MLSGDNSILQKATDAKTKTERQSVIEQARTDVLGYQAENKGENLNKTQLKSVLDKYFDGVPDLTNMEKDAILNIELNTLAKYGTHTIAVAEIYNGNLKGGAPQETGVISLSEVVSNADEFYGSDITNYTSENGYNTWKIFYADSNNIYLIASDNIPNTTDLKGKDGSSFIKGNNNSYKFGSGTYGVNDGVLQDYQNGTDELIDTTYVLATKIKALNSQYFATFPEKRIETNKIAIASMLDTTVWKEYMDSLEQTGKAEYAIGGPTIEMLSNSYNRKNNLFNNQNEGKYQVDVPSTNNSGYGYMISYDYGNTWDSYIVGGTDVGLSTSDSLYVTQNIGYWIASPSAHSDITLMSVSSSGWIGVQSEYARADSFGFRPVVCLKSEIQLEKVENGKYKIVY